MPIAKPNKQCKNENHRPITLTNIHGKILSKMLANQIQQYIKRIKHHEQVRLMPGIKRWRIKFVVLHLLGTFAGWSRKQKIRSL